MEQLEQTRMQVCGDHDQWNWILPSIDNDIWYYSNDYSIHITSLSNRRNKRSDFDTLFNLPSEPILCSENIWKLSFHLGLEKDVLFFLFSLSY